MIIKVTQELIDNDKPEWNGKRCRTCPVALAIQSLLRKDLEIGVVGHRFYIYRDSVRLVIIDLPAFVHQKIKLIDDRKSVDAFDFEIDIPAEFLC